MGVHIRLLGVNFNNPDLESIPVFGFADEFNRAEASTLGRTEAGKVWEVQPANNQQGINAGQAYIARAAAPFGPTYAVLDAGTPDGVMEIRLTASDINVSGMALRVQSLTNYLRFVVSDTAYRLEKVVGGTTSLVWSSASGRPTVPLTLRAELRGPAISLYANGELLTTMEIPDGVRNTRHGIFSSGQGVARFDYARFTA